LITLARLIATWFYCGLVPVAPGTAGSIAAIVIAWALNRSFGTPPLTIGMLGLILAIPGVWAAGVTASAMQKKDPQIIVVDEVVGQWITIGGALNFRPDDNPTVAWPIWLAAFVLFRLFDIWKPPPVRQLERLPGGLGIVADDAMAGVYAAVILYALCRLPF
jgi:phosphatidylglycerophosphatase A